jgi:RimJ/RimL family protein N-acetyltransferase
MKDLPDQTPRTNEFGQPIGFALPGWKSPAAPPHVPLRGRYCRLEPLSAARHARDIYEAQSEDQDGTRWTYSFHGPYDSVTEYEVWCVGAEASRDPQFYAIVDSATGRAAGTCTYMRIEPRHGVIEVGNIYFSPRLARTRAATEAMYLLMANAFDLGYRRYEWKCDSCNLPSRAAATRFGFTYEGLFRQAIVNKGRNRDTSWFSVIDGDWNGGLKEAYQRWLSEDNFDAGGAQKLRLSDLTAPFVHARS